MTSGGAPYNVVVAGYQPGCNAERGWNIDLRVPPIRSDRKQVEVAWMGDYAAKAVNLRRPEPPRADPRWRVTVEEWERFCGDPGSDGRSCRSGGWADSEPL